jgi:hypothetical protein
MDRLTFSKSDCKVETTSAWLATVLQFANKIGFLQAFETFKIKMKARNYTVHQKLLTTIISIIAGCEFTKDINEKLSTEKLSANMLGMDQFPDQSQINILLNRMDDKSIDQLRDIHNTLYKQNSNSIYSNETIVVDFDQSGLIANGKTYELAEKGYFAKKKNQSGYQLSAAFAGKHSEAIELFLDSGDTHCSSRFEDLLKSTITKFKEHIKSGNLIIRTDSGYGSLTNIEVLDAIPGLKYVTKGYSIRQAAKLAKDISFEDYQQVNESVWVYELPRESKRRIIIVQTLTKHGGLVYTMLATNVEYMSAIELFHFYNGRQTIEAFFKMAKNVYSIKNLRTRGMSSNGTKNRNKQSSIYQLIMI